MSFPKILLQGAGEHRLGLKLLAAILLASSCLALLSTAVQLYLDYARDLTEIDSQFKQIESTNIASLANSLWLFDEQQVRLQLDGLVKMRDVQYAEVQGATGTVFLSGHKSPKRRIERQYLLRAPNAQHSVLGTLTVGVGMEGVYHRLLDRTIVILATQTIKTFFIALFILYIVSRWVTSHLEHMARHARSLRGARLGQPLVLARPAGRSPDELDDVVAALNEMSRAVAEERNRLEHTVALRTADLQVAKERAEEASAAKSAFLAKMSHELRTPLNAILGYAQLFLMDASLTPKQATWLQTVKASGEHLLTLINDILDLSKVEAGKTELRPTSIELCTFVAVIADIVRVKAEERGLHFAVHMSPELPRCVMADERRLRQVLLNLLGNAVKFTDRGDVQLAILRSGAGRVRFEVHDTGVGIAANETRDIFEPFEQVGGAAGRAGGTGLGLAISRELVRLMGGEIHVESEPGQGSVFWFELTLPACAMAAAAATELKS